MRALVRAGEEVVFSSQSNRFHLSLDSVVIEFQIAAGHDALHLDRCYRAAS